jgi:hypothetical protein
MWFHTALHSQSEYDARGKKATAVIWLLKSHPVQHVWSIKHFSLSKGKEFSDGLRAAVSV